MVCVLAGKAQPVAAGREDGLLQIRLADRLCFPDQPHIYIKWPAAPLGQSRLEGATILRKRQTSMYARRHRLVEEMAHLEVR